MHMLKVGRQAALGQEQDAKGPCSSFQSCIDGAASPVQTVSTMEKETVPEMFRICTDFAITSPKP
jgi:hypothetical protein